MLFHHMKDLPKPPLVITGLFFVIFFIIGIVKFNEYIKEYSKENLDGAKFIKNMTIISGCFGGIIGIIIETINSEFIDGIVTSPIAALIIGWIGFVIAHIIVGIKNIIVGIKNTTRKKPESKKWFIILFIVLLVIVIGGFVSCFSESDCDNCSATGKTSCTSCGGRGNNTCSNCNGKGYTTGFFNNSPCSNCNKTGNITCYSCNGTAQVTCYRCSGRGKIKD